jgi:adenosylcobinamide kinase / adenosylcobinamide-phosphate guanylyltransferase
MAKIALVTGGCRSGKSDYAQRLAESLPPPRLYVATCPVTDDEMASRIERHRQARRDRDWQTAEEQIDLRAVLSAHAHHNAILIDCVTLWINNLMYQAERQTRRIGEDEIADRVASTLDAAAACRGTVIFVTNEVGLGVVPENAQARCYRDLVGRANQILAARAESVTLLCCGIPVQLKGRTTP